MKKCVGIAAALVLLLSAVFQDGLIRQYVRQDGGALDRFARELLASTEEECLSAQYGPWNVTVWRDAAVVEFHTRQSPAFGGVEKGFYYAGDDAPDSFQATGYPLLPDGGDWRWEDPYGNHGRTGRIRPRWFWYEAVL